MAGVKAPPWESASAVLSEDGVYRYELWRTLGQQLGSKGTVAFCMLNPSTADATTDDPTIRRCVGFARRWGYHKLAVVNLYPLRASSPADLRVWLRGVRTPGMLQAKRDNMMHLGYVLSKAELCVAAWGQHGHGSPPATELLTHYTWYALALNKNGSPAHPLYQPNYVQPRLLVKRTQWALA